MQAHKLGLWFLAVVLSLGLLSACGGEETTSATAPAGAAKKGAEADKGAGKDKGKPGEMEEPSKPTVWTYNPTGKRDIFEIPPLKVSECSEKPLVCYDLRQLWVDAIIYGSGMDMAHVIMPNGKDAMVRVGDEVGLNHGRIKQIRQKEIVVEEIYVDPATRDIHIIEKIITMR